MQYMNYILSVNLKNHKLVIIILYILQNINIYNGNYVLQFQV